MIMMNAIIFIFIIVAVQYEVIYGKYLMDVRHILQDSV